MATIVARQAGKQMAKKQVKRQMQKKVKKQVQKKVKEKVEDKVKEKAQEKLHEKLQDSVDRQKEKKASVKASTKKEKKASVKAKKKEKKAREKVEKKKKWKKRKKKVQKLKLIGPIKMDIRDELGLGDLDIDRHDVKDMVKDQLRQPPKIGFGLFGKKKTSDDEDKRQQRKGVRYSIFALCRGVGKFYRFLGRFLPCCRTGTFANQITKNVAGFVCGLVFLVLFYPIFILALKQEPKQAARTITVIGPIVCFGMAFSSRIRCVILLMVPQLFSGKGRTILMAYAFLLVLSGPVENLSYNMDMAGQSQVCGSELAMNQSQKLFQVVTAPMASFAGEVKSLIDQLRAIGRRIKEGFRAIKDAVESLGNAVGEFFDWIGDMVDQCNERLGIPEKRCRRVFEHAAATCRKKTGIFGFVCGIVDLVSNVCFIPGLLKILCIFPQGVKFIAEEASERVERAMDSLKDEFYVDFEFRHEMSMDYNFSQSARQIRENILGEMEERTETFLTVVFWLNHLMSFAFVLLLLKSYNYYHKYRVKDKFDNWYVTDNFEAIDERREEMGKETLLPLKIKERLRYVTPSSVYLAKPEKRRIALGMVMWITQVGYAAVLMVADCTAYWFLDLVRLHSELHVHINAPGAVTLDVQGDGLLADIYRSLVQSLDPRLISNFEVDTSKCLPHPSLPDTKTYRVIGVIFGIALFLILFEAYGLRLRRLIMLKHYPEREKIRAIWLYNQILRRRGGFRKFLKRNKKKDQGTRDYSFASHLASRSKILAMILKICGFKWKFCVCCSVPGKVEDTEGFVNCANAGCQAIYCLECINDMHNMCQICSGLVDYGVDIEKFDIEKGSSDEDDRRRRHVYEEEGTTEEESEDDTDLDYSYQFKLKVFEGGNQDEDDDDDDEDEYGTNEGDFEDEYDSY